MRGQLVRLGILFFVLTFPVLIDAASGSVSRGGPRAGAMSRASRPFNSPWRIQGVQVLLLAGLTFAGWERRRLRTLLVGHGD
jgi:hypothetical protein